MAKSLSPEETAEYQAAFNVFDKDGNGSVSSEELAGIMKAQGVTLSTDQVNELIKKYDKNGDGDIDFDEFTQMVAESDIARAVRYATVFKSLDTDGDGSVSAAELRAALEKRGLEVTEGQLQGMLKAADTDGNGQLSFEEFLKCVAS